MSHNTDIRRIAFIADYWPRKCGIATFTHDLHNAIEAEYPAVECSVVAVNDQETGYEYPPEVRFEIGEQDIAAYSRAAYYLNCRNSDVVSVQHEFGIFGGSAGAHLLNFLSDLRIPVVTTLHTILETPDREQRHVMDALTSLSARMVVMSARGREFLTDIYNVPEKKIDLIPHGIPDMPFVDPNFYKDLFDVEGKHVLLTFGLLSPNKGIEIALRALPQVVKEFPNLVYIVLGATHPNLLRDAGETYRLSLESLVRDLGIQENVAFYNQFVELEQLKEFIGAADIYITPYLNPAQIISGTLAYAFGCGKAVISTPYRHAEELLADGRGALVPFGDSDAIAREILSLLQDEPRRHAMRKRAYLLGREMIWSKVAGLYMDSFQKARETGAPRSHRFTVARAQAEPHRELPLIMLDHLQRMTDTTGVLQHAKYTLPDYAEGYCTDDNARALILTVLLEGAGHSPGEVRRLNATYAAFLNYAFDPERVCFRNFMSYDRHWLEDSGSNDSHGRSLWALGVCVGRSRRAGLRMWAAGIFEQALPSIAETTSPRAWAFALLGIHEYLRQMSGDRFVAQMRDTLTTRLIDLYDRASSDKWRWFEKILTYDNAVLSHALLVSGQDTENARAFDIGQRSLRWLAQLQRTESGQFRPIGSNGFYPCDGERALFDQQPLEAWSMISAALQAHRALEDPFWLDTARATFDWFLGRNDLGLPLCDSGSGGCRDGLHMDRINQNQGAESTLAYLLSLTELILLENSLRVTPRPEDVQKAPTAIVSSAHHRQEA